MDDRWKNYVTQACGRLKSDVMYYSSSTPGKWYSGIGNIINSKMTENSSTICAGVIAFGSVNALSCWIQGSIVGVSTGTIRPFPTIFGIATIATASYVAHSAAICSDHFRTERNQRHKSIPEALNIAWNRRPSMIDQRHHNDVSAFWTNGPNHNPYLHTIRVCVVGLLCFKLLGGRFWSIAPSSYTHVGSYARGSIAATDQYATPTQRLAIQRLGRIFGCHTCGRKPLPFLPSSTTMSFIGDHQPPKSVAHQLNQQWFRRLFRRKVPFRFYPHCMTCSNKQGGILASATFDLAKAKSWNHWLKNMASPKVSIPSLRAAGGGTNAYMHGFQPRLYHLTGGVIAAWATADNDQGRQRYTDLQSYFTKAFGRPYEAAAKYFQQIQNRKSIQHFSNVGNRFHQRLMKQFYENRTSLR
jgi:hypothetical protein